MGFSSEILIHGYEIEGKNVDKKIEEETTIYENIAMQDACNGRALSFIFMQVQYMPKSTKNGIFLFTVSDVRKRTFENKRKVNSQIPEVFFLMYISDDKARFRFEFGMKYNDFYAKSHFYTIYKGSE
ncbi:hypothetical protein TNIN_51511 [Trichonephila inaurata madagascariensis]|uniref:Uncharacterized protein n=1 Tax=Trichonephila inaurata madagascariensis TaxID=2747483 RepID=A0A8X7BTE4_9ARAC|nr:hypothetical protein TNIN_51511 [Trichonephila inaurata madagascariensis]